MLKKLYEWTAYWANTRYGATALFLLAFCESVFFPVPPDVLLIAMGTAAYKKSIKYAILCSIGSLAGGIAGYMIGELFMESVGIRIIDFYSLGEKAAYIKELYSRYDAWAIAIAGFTPIPYKVFTITAGAFDIDFKVFITASAISRTLRFMIVGGLMYFVGPHIQFFIKKYFNILAILFVILLAAGFFVLF